MNAYLKVYRWALGMKLHMGIYTCRCWCAR